MNIGVVGNGKMGGAFARRLLEKGYSVSVWDRASQHALALASAGATPRSSLAELLNAVDVVIVSLWGDDAARDVTLNQIIPSLREAQTLVEMSTLSPRMYEVLERSARERGRPFVAAPVLGNPDAVSAGGLTVLAGGTKENVQRVREILDSLGNVTEMPSVGASGYLKLSNNIVLGVVAETLGEVLNLCVRAGIDHTLAVRSLTGAFERAVQSKLAVLLSGDTTPRFALNALLKDLQLGHDAANSMGAAMPLLQALLPEAEGAVERGLGDRDYIALAVNRS